MQANSPLQMTGEQREICRSSDSRILVEANAGSGKTTTAAMMIAGLIEGGVNPSKILALSFTRPGAQAYSDAFRRLGLRAAVTKTVRVGTFEDFCASRIRRVEGVDVERLTRPEQVRPFVLSAIPKAKEWVEERYPGEFSVAGTGEFAVEGLLGEIAHVKGTMQLALDADHFRLSPAGANEMGRDFTTLAIHRAYEWQRRHFADADSERPRYRYLGDATYDLACALVSDDPPFTWENHPLRLGIEAVVLDEMHDTSRSMFTVLKELLALNEGVRFLGVGDRDQVIHAQDGADAHFMGDGFDRDIGPPRRLPLTQSYRFGAGIAQPLAIFSGKAYPVHPTNSSRAEVRRTDSANDILAIINDAVTKRPGLQASSGASQVAVLLRHPSEAAELEHELLRTGIRYEAVGFTTYLQRPEILFVRLLLMAAVGLEEQLSSRVLAEAKRSTWEFVGGTLKGPSDAVDPTASYIDSTLQPNFAEWVLPRLLETTSDELARLQVREAMRLAASNRIEDLAASVGALDVQRLARRVFVNQQTAIDAQASVSSFARAGQRYGSISAFLKSLISYDYEAHSGKLAHERIVLSSIEAAKGLEFDHVIVPAVNRSEFDGDNDDDRNLFYVAASRARRLLTLTHRPDQASSYLGPYLSSL